MWDILIVGGGAAGCSAAIYAARFGLRTLLLDRNAGIGQLAQAAEIENYPGFRSIAEKSSAWSAAGTAPSRKHIIFRVFAERCI